MRLVKVLAAVLVLGATVAATPVPAQARWHGGHGWHHGWRGGGWGWGLGFGPGFALGYGAGYPYYYGGGPYYYGGPACDYVRVWRRGHWVRVRRCW